LSFILGVNNCWAAKRFIEPKEWVKIAATELEVSYVQFSFDVLDPGVDMSALNSIASETLDCCSDYGVKIHSCFTGLAAYSYNLLLHPYSVMRQKATEWYEKALTLAAKLKAEAAGGFLGAFSVKDFRDEKRRQLLLSSLIGTLKHLSHIGKKHGLKYLLWEPMPVSREPPATIEETKILLSLVNKESAIPIKLCLDVGHACNPDVETAMDRDPYMWLKILGKDSPCIHIQQTDGKADRHWPFTKEYNKVGIIKGDRVLSALRESGANLTYLFLEVIHPFEYPDEQVIKEIKASVNYWKSYL